MSVWQNEPQNWRSRPYIPSFSFIEESSVQNTYKFNVYEDF